jgi:hypothetical protein
MGTDLAKLQVDMQKVVHNAQEKELKSFDMFYSPTAKDIELESYDENGVLKTYKIPNLSKSIKNFMEMLSGTYSSSRANTEIRMGSSSSTNFDGITYDDSTNTFKFFVDQARTATPLFEVSPAGLKHRGKAVAGSTGAWVQKFSGRSTHITNRWGDGKYLLYMDLGGSNLAFILEVSETKAKNYIQSNAYFHGSYVYTAKYDGNIDKFVVIRWRGFTSSGAALQTVKKIYKWE